MRWLWLSLLIVAAILVPFFLFEDQVTALALRLTSGQTSAGYAALVIGALLASDVVLPIPSSIVSAAAGALLGFWRSFAVIWIGMTISCAIGYWIGARSAGAARRFVGDASLARATDLARRFGGVAIVICRPVPVLAEASTVVAGLLHQPVSRFLMLTAAANAGVALSYAAIGTFSMEVESFLLTFLGAILIPAAGALVARLWFGGGVRR